MHDPSTVRSARRSPGGLLVAMMLAAVLAATGAPARAHDETPGAMEVYLHGLVADGADGVDITPDTRFEFASKCWRRACGPAKAQWASESAFRLHRCPAPPRRASWSLTSRSSE